MKIKKTFKNSPPFTFISYNTFSDERAKSFSLTLGKEFAAKIYRCTPISLYPKAKKQFHQGFCEQVLWPGLHSRLDLMNFKEKDWNIYRRVNALVARNLMKTTSENHPLWIDGYHLLLVPQMIRQWQKNRSILFSLETPWPSTDIALKIPHAESLIHSLKQADTIVFQSERSKDAFFASSQKVSNNVGSPIEKIEKKVILFHKQPNPELKAICKGIDWQKLLTPRPQKELRSGTHHAMKVIGVDPFDYSRGINLKLVAFHDFLELHPEKKEKIVFRQVLVPTTSDTPARKRYQKRVIHFADYINRKFGNRSWKPVDLVMSELKTNEVMQFYRDGNVFLSSSAPDTFMQEALEYIAAQDSRNPGVLLLSHNCAAKDFLTGALLFNPTEPATAIRSLWQAITMPKGERILRWNRNVNWVSHHNQQTFLEEVTKSLLPGKFYSLKKIS